MLDVDVDQLLAVVYLWRTPAQHRTYGERDGGVVVALV